MVFLSGPRQVGKTTLAQSLIKRLNGRYLLYDNPHDRRVILDQNFLTHKVVCLDEFHKYNRWKDFLKGIYDKHRDQLTLLATGSARLDIYQQSGDSLFGRFYLHHLHPLSLAELNKRAIVLPENLLIPRDFLDGLQDLLMLSGFPEPFFSGRQTEILRW